MRRRGSPEPEARDRLRAVGIGYIKFALDEPGWFAVALFGADLTGLEQDGTAIAPPYLALVKALDAMVEAGALSPNDATAPSGRAGRRCTDSPNWSCTDRYATPVAVTLRRWLSAPSTTSLPVSPAEREAAARQRWRMSIAASARSAQVAAVTAAR